MARAAAPAKKVEAVKAPEDAKKSVFVAEIRARFGGVRDITGTQVMDMCNTLEDGDPRDPRLPRPGWFLDSDEFAPDKATCHAAFATIGAVPVGEDVWEYWDGGKWVGRTLTVAEL